MPTLYRTQHGDTVWCSYVRKPSELAYYLRTTDGDTHGILEVQRHPQGWAVVQWGNVIATERYKANAQRAAVAAIGEPWYA